MTADSPPPRGIFGLGGVIGRVMAERIIDLTRPGATIIDNHSEVFIERRRPSTDDASGIGPKRRSTDREKSE